MKPPLGPLVFDPIFVKKPWGGRNLEKLFGKKLPPNDPIGESWEIADLPSASSVVRDGPHRSRTLHELLGEFERELLGNVQLVAGGFPLLIKFLDATQDLSIQVHPRHSPDQTQPIKDEAWYVLHAEPGAFLYAGFNPGVTPVDAERAAGTAAFVSLMKKHVVDPGDTIFLRSGTVHALGAGIVVAEIQTPSDITYRLYDWDRLDAGKPRELHLADGLRNIDWDANRNCERIASAPNQFDLLHTLVRAASFEIGSCRSRQDTEFAHRTGTAILVVLHGLLGLRFAGEVSTAAAGDVVLIPASLELNVRAATDAHWLEVRAK